MTPDDQLDRVAYRIPEWGRRYGFRRTKSFNLIADGRGPRTVMIGGERFVTREADEAWRRSLPAKGPGGRAA